MNYNKQALSNSELGNLLANVLISEGKKTPVFEKDDLDKVENGVYIDDNRVRRLREQFDLKPCASGRTFYDPGEACLRHIEPMALQYALKKLLGITYVQLPTCISLYLGT